MAKRGLFITFEGMDGSGKTSQIHRLARRLRAEGRTVLETAEPGGTEIGMQIRHILLDAKNRALAPAAELLLYFACRAQNVEQWILPALDRGEIVISDRFTDSSLVYQGCGRGLGAENVMALDRIACRGLKPDLTLFLDIDLATSLARAESRNVRVNRADRMEQEPGAFYEKVRDAYKALAAAEPERFRILDGNENAERVAEQVWKVVSEFV